MYSGHTLYNVAVLGLRNDVGGCRNCKGDLSVISTFMHAFVIGGKQSIPLCGLRNKLFGIIGNHSLSFSNCSKWQLVGMKYLRTHRKLYQISSARRFKMKYTKGYRHCEGVGHWQHDVCYCQPEYEKNYWLD